MVRMVIARSMYFLSLSSAKVGRDKSISYCFKYLHSRISNVSCWPEAAVRAAQIQFEKLAAVDLSGRVGAIESTVVEESLTKSAILLVDVDREGFAARITSLTIGLAVGAGLTFQFWAAEVGAVGADDVARAVNDQLTTVQACLDITFTGAAVMALQPDLTGAILQLILQVDR